MVRARRLIPMLVLALAVTGCAGSPSPTESSAESPGGASFGALPTDAFDAEVETKLQGVIDSIVESGMPDVIAAAVSPDGRWSGSAGVDGPDGRLAGVDDEFAIASISKAFTATLIMRLVDDGKIELDDPLASYLGDIEVDANDATVRQALQMLSGIPGSSEESVAQVAADPSRVWTPVDIAADLPAPVGKAGGEYIYSNPTYKMLGFAVENVTGQSLGEAMRALVLDPAGSPDSLLVQTPLAPLPEPWALPTSGTQAPLEAFGVGSALPNISDATFSAAAAGMAGTASGVADWAWQLFAGKVLSPESLQNMMITTDADGSGSGLDELVGKNLPGAFGHTGSKDGYESVLAVFPDDQTVIVVFINQTEAPVDVVAASLKDALEQ